MARLFVRHDVEDFGRWQSGYRAPDQVDLRSELRVSGQAVYQAFDNPNDVTVYHDFESLEDAQAFVADPRLVEAMERLGVAGAPHVWITVET